jgi:regulatory protein YycI of two-component signal transduction system YycFG
MEWERAKNYVLIAFVILNLGLAALIYLEDTRFTLTDARLSNIHAVLFDNNINLYTTPMRRFAPMRHLDISGFYYDIPALIEIFFENETVTIHHEGEGHYIIEAENGAELEISNGFISFDNSARLNENDENEISVADAIKISEEFIENHFSDFVRDIVFEDFGGVHIIYLQEYRGRLIDSNFIEFFVVSEGIVWIDMQFGQVLGHSAETRMIFAPDEILLTFMQRVRHRAMENPIFISDIDIVYKQEYASDQIGAVYPAVPFYRIFIRGQDFPFYINAYTNVITQ